MERRKFITSGIGAGIATGAAITFGGVDNLFAGNAALPYDLVAVRGGEPDIMFDKGIESLGGMSQFVKPGQKVLIKPNIGWDRVPERGANTNPILVKRIVEQCLKAGAKEVFVFDHTCHEWTKCYKNSGIEAAVIAAGGKMVPGDSERYYQKVEFTGGSKLKEMKVHELLVTSDVFINVPILKNHSSSKLSISMKNMMGCVWDRGFWHKNDLHQCIADFLNYKKPDLNVVDAYYVLKTNGPMGVSLDDVITMKSLIISRDIVAADSAATKFFGKDPAEINHIQLASAAGLGQMDLSKLNINRINL